MFAVFVVLARGQAVFSVGWNSMNAMPTMSKYGAQSATAVDSLQLIYAAAAWYNPQSYYKYTTLTDQWTQGAPGLVDCLRRVCSDVAMRAAVRSHRRAVHSKVRRLGSVPQLGVHPRKLVQGPPGRLITHSFHCNRF